MFFGHVVNQVIQGLHQKIKHTQAKAKEKKGKKKTYKKKIGEKMNTTDRWWEMQEEKKVKNYIEINETLDPEIYVDETY